MKFFKEVAEQRRKIRWSDSSKSTRVFLATLIIILFLVIVIGLFSWGMGAIIDLAI